MNVCENCKLLNLNLKVKKTIFCSQKCIDIFIKHSRYKKKGKSICCKQCKGYFYNYASRSEGKHGIFCSNFCNGKFRYESLETKKFFKIAHDEKKCFQKGYQNSKSNQYKGFIKTGSNIEKGIRYKRKTINGKQMQLHRYIMEYSIGRKLKEDEVVHHINENIHDNSIENLKIMSRVEHGRLHKKRN